jgi:nucleoside phosphorylase
MLHLIFNSEYKNTDQLFIIGLPKNIRNNCVEISNPTQFRTILRSLKQNEIVMIWVHIGTILASNQSLSGMVVEYAEEAEEFLEKYKIEYKKITRGSEIAAKSPEIVFTNDMVDISNSLKKYYVSELQQILSLEANDNKDDAQTKEKECFIEKNRKFPKFKYAIITALYDSEFEELNRIFDFPKNEHIKTQKKSFYKGYFKKNKDIQIIAAVPNATGMLDSSILATMMLEYFNPDYLLMSGVCGGAENTNYGDIILAKQLFTFQKGKISDLKNEDRTESKFEVEHDSILPLDSHFEDNLNPELKKIKQSINQTIENESFFENKKIDIKIQPIACSNMVINKKDYFENTIKAIHRKTAAVEMESYGVARACQYANNGNTIPIIFKSVMDKTFNKEDKINDIDLKKFAAFTSAQFMGLLFENQII